MSTTVPRLAAIALGLFLGATTVQAQLLDSVKGALGGGSQQSSGGGSLLGGLGGASMPSLGSVGTGNITGILTYCAKNNYLGGGASSVKDKLLGKLGGEQQAQSDPGYREGLSGILGGNSGQKMELGSGGGLKQQITEKVCDQVLQYGQSLL
ncbi:DUF2501 domain-containing protein [Pigmentiphaga sp.]|uniref:DUF2501 domain-containing protein n=1 Tax=Pigmentiphaga sp. TaxID=1977564 RepID=UPI00128B207B|nr:DUF2501 domain-containing protein [Pigmentiphaga sp.]MPS26726.1 DUF2501 domain-containing protein [Alcaligenaceae bacterium SAGV5]MPS53752.1 DUF2501 domain-containing protein [Alcaligenaceae bacterium SAGV3]MPT59936.1 DUF2501 domain-containing protein [Alcaligenaceae bacterium]